MKKRKNLRQYLTFPVFLVSLLPISLFALISIIYLRNTLYQDMEVHIASNLEKAEQSLDMVLDKYTTILYDLCTDDETVKIMQDINRQKDDLDVNTSKLRRELGHICNRNNGIAGITVFMESGEVIFYDRLSAAMEGGSWAEEVARPKEARGEQYIGVTKPLKMENEELYVFRIARNVLDYQDVHEKIGMIVISIEEQVLSDALQSGHDTEIYLMDDNGEIFCATDKSLIGFAGEKAQINTDRYAAIKNKTSGWTVCIRQFMDAYRQTVTGQLLFLFLCSLGAFLILLLIIQWMTRPLIRGVNYMVAGMNRVEQGDFSTRIRVSPKLPEEAEQIGDGFNHMVAHIDSLINQVKNAVIEQKNAELAALEAQIDPHFLYNTLDTINWKAIEKEEYEISEMVGALADILRYSIQSTNSETSIEQELYWLEQYILLQSKKLGKPLQTVVDVPESLIHYKIHKLLLQPFVENAMKHGFRKVDRPCVLTISMRETDKQIHICVEDNGKGMDDGMLACLNETDAQMGEHLGVINVRKRLELYYGDEADIYFESEPDRYTRVHLFIPKERRGV